MSTENQVSRDAPLHLGTVSLVVRDLDRVASFYRDVIGLAAIEHDGSRLLLGAGDDAFLELRHDPAARAASPREAGLFHTAFLLPSRAELGRWLRHLAENRIRIDGASDHAVSEAIYLSDPEGNGIEVYADRPVVGWPRNPDGSIAMVTERLDAEDLIEAAAPGAFERAPVGTCVGHVHLRVAEVEAARGFFESALGLETVARLPGAAFLSTGGYHHHLGVNSWASRGARPREPGTAGLAAFELAARDEAAFERAEAAVLASGTLAVREGDAIRLAEPGGIGIVLRRAFPPHA